MKLPFRTVSAVLAFVVVHCDRPQATTNTPHVPTTPTAPSIGTMSATPTTITTTIAAAQPTALMPSTPPTPVVPGELRVDSAALTALITEGAEAPHFRAVAHNGTVIESASGARLRPLVVYFYPRDETPGCTVEAEGFRDAAAQYAQAGIEVIGVSTDPIASHQGFATAHQLGFPLVSDPDGRLAASFGVTVRAGFAQRVTILISKLGIVKRVYPSVSPTGHATEVLAAARSI